WVAIAAGDTHAMALDADGGVTAWGTNSYGQTDVPEGAVFTAIAAGSDFSVGLLDDGSL
ncbi:MAG TPA: hypothetical protein DEO57_08570, partial [Phycisphaerales bacterium]|nr:hypothetical protein [Phycisphaerales bacterium]